MHVTIIPIKSSTEGKKRLKSTLTPSERKTLIFTLLKDVLTASTQSKNTNLTLVVTPDPKIIKYVKNQAYPNLEFLLEPSAQGTNHAVQLALSWCREHTANSVLIIPADLPLIKAKDIDALIALGHSTNTIILIPSERKDGTNAFLQPLPSPAQVWYGPGSFQRNVRTLSHQNIPYKILNQPTLALDIDVKADVLKLQQLRDASFTVQWVKGLKL